MFDNFCSLFSNLAQPGQYAYEAFKKMPHFSVLAQAANMLSGNTQGGLIGNIGSISNIVSTAGNALGFNNFTNQAKNIGGIAGIIAQFINNVPQ
jgi:hypothetical protein